MKGLLEALQSSNKRDGVRGVTANLPLTDGFLHHGWFARASVRMARGLDMPSRSFDVDSVRGRASRGSHHAKKENETASPTAAPCCPPPQAPSTNTKQGKLRASLGDARATASASPAHPDQDETLRDVLCRVDAMRGLFPSTR